jgi:hypothetical protein
VAVRIDTSNPISALIDIETLARARGTDAAEHEASGLLRGVRRNTDYGRDLLPLKSQQVRTALQGTPLEDAVAATRPELASSLKTSSARLGAALSSAGARPVLYTLTDEPMWLVDDARAALRSTSLGPQIVRTLKARPPGAFLFPALATPALALVSARIAGARDHDIDIVVAKKSGQAVGLGVATAAAGALVLGYHGWNPGMRRFGVGMLVGGGLACGAGLVTYLSADRSGGA